VVAQCMSELTGALLHRPVTHPLSARGLLYSSCAAGTLRSWSLWSDQTPVTHRLRVVAGKPYQG
jgi:hypothetical protein